MSNSFCRAAQSGRTSRRTSRRRSGQGTLTYVDKKLLQLFSLSVGQGVDNLCSESNPKALGTHILRLLGPKAILSRAFWGRFEPSGKSNPKP